MEKFYRINRNSQFLVSGVARIDLGLKGNELIAYSIVSSIAMFTGTTMTNPAEYISEFIGITKQEASQILNELVRKGLMFKDTRLVQGLAEPSYGVI